MFVYCRTHACCLPCPALQVVIEAGANGISNAAIQVSDSPALPGAPAARPGATSTVCAANITVLQPGTPISTTTLGCAATGRYMTITADQPMDLCRYVLGWEESMVMHPASASQQAVAPKTQMFAGRQ